MSNRTIHFIRNCLACVMLMHAASLMAFGSPAASMMSQAMLAMMDAMGSLAYDYRKNKQWPSYGWPGTQMPPVMGYSLPGVGMPGGMESFQNLHEAPAEMMKQAPITAQGLMNQPGTWNTATNENPLNGVWQGQRGEVVLVLYGHFRIYASPEVYRDGVYTVDERYITMRDPSKNREFKYEYAYKEGRLVFRDPQGNLMLFRKFPIPVPSYDSFSGSQDPSNLVSDQQTDTHED